MTRGNGIIKMKIWIFQTGEAVPLLSQGARAMRLVNLTDALLNEDHEVVVWTSTFSHQTKKFFRKNKFESLKYHKLEVKLIPCFGYKKNIGLARLVDHCILAINLRRALNAQKDTPDVMFVGFPPIFWSNVAFTWGEKNKIPVVLDVKDQWPQVFAYRVPVIFKLVVKFLIFPQTKITKKLFKKVDVVTTISDGFLKWIYAYSGRLRSDLDGVFYLTPGRREEKPYYSVPARVAQKKTTEECFKVLFVGSLSASFDFKPVMEAALYAVENDLPWVFYVCGSGPNLNKLKRQAAKLNNVRFTGYVGEEQIKTLAMAADAALAPYNKTPDFQLSIPNKVLDYLSFGLPVVTSLDGELGSYLFENRIGLTYDPDVKLDLSHQLQQLTKNEELLREFSENAHKQFWKELSYDVVYENLTKMLTEVVASREHTEVLKMRSKR